MTQEDVIRLAREAGYQHSDAVGQCEDFAYFDLEAFAKLVAEHERAEFAVHAVDIARRSVAEEREACAKLCEELNDIASSYGVAQAIRARGQA